MYGVVTNKGTGASDLWYAHWADTGMPVNLPMRGVYMGRFDEEQLLIDTLNHLKVL